LPIASQLIGSALPIKIPVIKAIDTAVRESANFMAKDLIRSTFHTGFSLIGVEKAPLWVR
jgi:hypothetical protein